MKKIFSLSLIFVLLLSFCACELTDTLTDSELTGGEEEQEKVTSLEGLSLVYFDDKGTHPLMDPSLANQQIYGEVYQPAFTFNEQMEMEYGCATSVEMSGTTVMIQPDTGRLFSDGTRLSAEIMAKCYQYVLDRPESPYYRQLSVIESVRAQGGRVCIILKKQHKAALYGLNIPIVYEKDGTYYGCGAYMISKYQDEPALMANPHGETAPTVTPIRLLDPANESVLASMFNSGVLGVLPQNLLEEGSLSVSREYESISYLTNCMLYVGVNVRQEGRNNALRRALSALIPREDIVKSVLMEQGVATISPFYPYWSETIGTVETADKEEMFRLFTSAGYHEQNGELLTAQNETPTFEILVCEDSKTNVAVAEKIRSAGQALGLVFTIESVSEEAYFSRLEDGRFDLYVARYEVSPLMDPTPLFAENGDYNYGGVSLPSLDKAYDELMGGEESMEDYMTQFTRECPILPIAFTKNTVYYTAGITPAGNISSSDPLGDLACWNIK